MTWTIFYAWQSDRPNNTNRGLIQRALEDGIDEVRAGGNLVVDPRLDKDTLGIPGSPDIETTIFEKISQAAVFVADVTLVTPEGSDRPSPNPNVLVELGYAIRALGSERVIMVMNTAFGRPDDLPFDIRRKRTLTYRLPEDAPEKAPERKLLQKQLTEAVRASLAFAERARPKEPSALSPADALISAIADRSPALRSTARRYVDSTVQELVRLRPKNGLDDEALVAAIENASGIVATFARVSETLAVYRHEEGVEEVLRLFEQILARYNPLQGFTGTYNITDFDFFKFLGHELFVVLTVALLREEGWSTLDQILRTPFMITGSVQDDKTVFFDRISIFVRLLDEVRREKLRTQGSARVSIRADILRARYTSGELAERVPWDQFRAADFFLYLRSRIEPGSEPRRMWRPWSAIFLHDLPPFITRSMAKAYAARLATGLGLPDTIELGRKLTEAIAALTRFYGADAFWDPPGTGFDWSKIASR